MYLRSDSAAGVRFLAAMAEGRGVKPSARAAGVGKETGYRWLRERFLASRALGVSVADARAELGYFSARVVEWDRDRAIGVPVRHHLAVPVDAEAEFWSRFLGGEDSETARRAAGIGRSTAYRWMQRRFLTLRDGGAPAAAVRRRLRIGPFRAAAWEAERRRALE